LPFAALQLLYSRGRVASLKYGDTNDDPGAINNLRIQPLVYTWTCFADATIITRNDAKINEEVAQRRRHRKLGRKKSPQLVALTSIKLVGARFLHGPRRTVQERGDRFICLAKHQKSLTQSDPQLEISNQRSITASSESKRSIGLWIWCRFSCFPLAVVSLSHSLGAGSAK
jgi:hypothetical protein